MNKKTSLEGSGKPYALNEAKVDKTPQKTEGSTASNKL